MHMINSNAPCSFLNGPFSYTPKISYHCYKKSFDVEGGGEGGWEKEQLARYGGWEKGEM